MNRKEHMLNSKRERKMAVKHTSHFKQDDKFALALQSEFHERTGVDLRNHPKSLEVLRNRAYDASLTLGKLPETVIVISDFVKEGGKSYDFNEVVTREQLEEIGKRTVNEIGIGDPDFDVEEDDSSSGDDEQRYEHLDCFFDEKQLKLMQLDNITVRRSYIYVICTNTTQKQEQDFLRVEEDIVQWPHEDVTFQYLMNNL
jgi:hypothetical protein